MLRATSPTRSHTPTETSLSSSSSSGSSRAAHDNEQLELPPEVQQELLSSINATVDYVLDSMAGDGPSRTYWRPKGVKKDVAYYVDDNVNADQYRFCCVTETSARTEELMKLFLMTDTDTLLKNNRVMYNNVLDARILNVLEKPSRETPFKSVYLRYSSFETPKLMDDRDMCVVVATDVFTHKDGSTIGYCLFDSVDLPDLDNLARRDGLVRCRMFRSGFFFHTTDEDAHGFGDGKITKIVYLVGMEPGGASPRLAAWLVMEKFGAVLGRLCNHFRRKHLDPTTFRPRDEWPSARATKQCQGCAKSFGSFSLRHNCVACGDVFCRACTIKENVDLPGVGITAVRLCLNCLDVRGVDTRGTCVGGDASRSTETTPSGRSTKRRSHAGSTTLFPFAATPSSDVAAHFQDNSVFTQSMKLVSTSAAARSGLSERP